MAHINWLQAFDEVFQGLYEEVVLRIILILSSLETNLEENR